MHISEPLLPYEKKTLILICDRQHAKFYQALDRDFDFVEEIKNDRSKLDDPEHYSAPIGGSRVAITTDEKLKDREAHAFYQDLAKKLFDLTQTDHEEILIAIPNDDKNILSDALHEQVKKLITLVIDKELTKMPEDKLIEIIDSHRRND